MKKTLMNLWSYSVLSCFVLVNFIIFSLIHSRDSISSANVGSKNSDGDETEQSFVSSDINKGFDVDPSGAFLINDTNYDSFIREFNTTLLFSFKHPCKLCRQIIPELQKTVNPLKSLSDPVYLGMLNITENPEVAKRLNLDTLFGLKYIVDKMPMEYTGGRTGEEIIAWVREKLAALVGEIKDKQEIFELIKFTENLILFIGEDSEKYAEFLRAAKSKEGIIYARCRLKDCLEYFKADEGDIIVFKRSDFYYSEKGDNENAETQNFILIKNSAYDENTLSNILDSTCLPRLLKFDAATAKLIFQKLKPGIFIYRAKSDEKLYDKILLLAFQEAKSAGLLLVSTDIVEQYELKLAQFLSFNKADLPRIVIHDTSQENQIKTYVMDKNISINKTSIVNFIQDFQSGKLKPFVKSQAQPKDPNASGAYTLVGTTLDSSVLDSTKDVLVMFYAPWCKNSKVLFPIFEKIGGKFKRAKLEDKFLIAKFDAYNNDASLINIEYYPTIALWPSDDKTKPIIFEGDYTNELSILEFLKNNSYNKFSLEEDEPKKADMSIHQSADGNKESGKLENENQEPPNEISSGASDL